jgi:hypothetical protein
VPVAMRTAVTLRRKTDNRLPSYLARDNWERFSRRSSRHASQGGTDELALSLMFHHQQQRSCPGAGNRSAGAVKTTIVQLAEISGRFELQTAGPHRGLTFRSSPPVRLSTSTVIGTFVARYVDVIRQDGKRRARGAKLRDQAVCACAAGGATRGRRSPPCGPPAGVAAPPRRSPVLGALSGRPGLV